MPKTLIALALAAAVACAPGCGTICNLASGDPEPYGGVANDFRVLTMPLGLCPQPGGGQGALILLGLWAADVGACVVADTLTLPLIVSWDKITWRGLLAPRPYALEERREPARFAAGAVSSAPALED